MSFQLKSWSPSVAGLNRDNLNCFWMEVCWASNTRLLDQHVETSIVFKHQHLHLEIDSRVNWCQLDTSNSVQIWAADNIWAVSEQPTTQPTIERNGTFVSFEDWSSLNMPSAVAVMSDQWPVLALSSPYHSSAHISCYSTLSGFSWAFV